MCAILLGLIVDLPIPGGHDSSRILNAARSLLDFLYLAQFQSHTSKTIAKLEESLATFHEFKEVFIDFGAREHFNIPKLHSLSHYATSIQLFGTTDNYNTEQSERLHIDLTKNAYRATNHKDEYAQMTVWLERREKLQRHLAFINWKQQNYLEGPQPQMCIGPPCAHSLTLRMARHPSSKAVSWDDLHHRYGAVEFQDALADFLAQVHNPGLSQRELRWHAANILIPFCAVPVFHNVKFTDGTEIADSVHARPEQRDMHGRIIPSRFDTALVQSGPQCNAPAQGIRGESQLYQSSNLIVCSGCQIAQVQVVFQIPSKWVQDVAPSLDTSPLTHLAYVEWFTPLKATPDPKHLMYRVSRQMQDGSRRASIISVDRIRCSIHLLPRFGPVIPQDWNSFTVLDKCHTFYVNPFSDVNNYLNFI